MNFSDKAQRLDQIITAVVGALRVLLLRRAGRGCLMLFLVSSAVCGGCDETANTCAGITQLGGVWWPGKLEVERNQAARNLSVLLRESKLKTPEPRQSAALAAAAAAVGQFGLAARVASRALLADPQNGSFVSLAVAARLALSHQLGSVQDFLAAAEMAQSFSNTNDAALQCNSLLILSRLGLPERVYDLRNSCPCIDALSLTSVGARSFGSSDYLPNKEVVGIEVTLGSNDLQEVRRRILAEAQAWRSFFAREALTKWIAASTQPHERTLLEQRLAVIARIYGEVTSDPAPVLLIDNLSSLSQQQVALIAPALEKWVKGLELISTYQVEDAESSILSARTVIATYISPLLPTVDVTLAALRYHLGDTQGMGEQAVFIHKTSDCKMQPWVCARALWLQAVSLQAEAEWEVSLEPVARASSLFASLGENANAGYVETLRGVALEAMGAQDEAEEAYLLAINKLAQTRDTKLRAGALSLFSRNQGRVGRPKVGIELQRGALHLDQLDGTPSLVAESTGLLAEQFVRAGNYKEAQAAIRRARVLIDDIYSPASSRRVLATLTLIEAELALRDSPKDAIDLLGRFINQTDAFGERYFRTEALLARSKAFSGRGAVELAREDLINALGEIAVQSTKISDRARSVSLFDKAREALDNLVAVLLEIDPSGASALEWIERLRLQQATLGLGYHDTPVDLALARGAEGTCITEYFALDHELLSWTTCNGHSAELIRTPIERRTIFSELESFRKVCASGRQSDIAAASARISEWLVRPQRSALDSALSWIVISDPLFPAIPFAWLQSRGRFLFEKFYISVAPSFAELHDSSLKATSWRVLALGDPAFEVNGATSSLQRLPYAAEEAKHISNLFTDSLAATGERATWSRVASRAGDFNLLHIAAHMTSGSQVPLAARLHLAAEPGRPNGRLSADEVASMKFPRLRLVFLASCSSSFERPARLAGSLDFSRAFLLAGAEEVVGTLWDVSDQEIAIASSEFYRYLKKGETARGALRRIWIDATSTKTMRKVRLSTLTSLEIATSRIGS